MPKKGPRNKPKPDFAAFLQSSIDNKSDPQHCGICLYGALTLVTANGVQDTFRRKVDFWKALYGFFVEPRTDVELQRVLHQLSQCVCPLSDAFVRQLHLARRAAGPDALNPNHSTECAPAGQKELYTPEWIVFIATAFNILHSTIRLSGVKSVAKGPVPTWPTTVTDLVPFGSDSLVQTLLQWYHILPDPIIFRLVAQIARVARVLVTPSLAKFKFTERVVLRGKETIELYETHCRTPPGNTPQSRQLLNDVKWHLTSVLEYFKLVYYGLPPHTWFETMAGNETKAMQLFSLMAFLSTHQYSKIDIVDFTTDCAHLCRVFFRFFHMHLYPHPDYPLHPRVVELDNSIFRFSPDNTIRAVPNAVIACLQSCYTDTRCSAHGCLSSIQSAGNNFQRCSRCQIVSYCGRECQTRSWREEKFPHKRLCPLIRLLVNAAGGLDMFVPNQANGLLAQLAGGEEGITSIILENWNASGVERTALQSVYDWARWCEASPSRRLPDGSSFNPGFDDYNDMVNRMAQPPRYNNRLARWPCEEAAVRATFEQLPFCQHGVDHYFDPLPFKL